MLLLWVPLQALMMTDGFLTRILNMNVIEDVPSGAGAGAGDSKDYSPERVASNLQLLFSHLLGSRSSYVEPGTFHAALMKEPWGDKKQQDSYQFLLYLLDTIGARCSSRGVAPPPSSRVSVCEGRWKVSPV